MTLNSGLPCIWRHPLCRHDRLSCTLRYLRWQCGARLLGIPAVVPWINGAQLVVSRGIAGAMGNVYCGLHEWPDMPFLLHLLRP